LTVSPSSDKKTQCDIDKTTKHQDLHLEGLLPVVDDVSNLDRDEVLSTLAPLVAGGGGVLAALGVAAVEAATLVEIQA
jgi:hypothetical protein